MFQFNEGDTVEVKSDTSALKGKRGKVVRVVEPGKAYSVEIPGHAWPMAFVQSELLHRFSEEETKENAEDFKNLIPMHIRMNEEEWNWFTSKLAEDEDSHLPNLKALAKHPPAGFKDLH